MNNSPDYESSHLLKPAVRAGLFVSLRINLVQIHGKEINLKKDNDLNFRLPHTKAIRQCDTSHSPSLEIKFSP